MLPHGQNYRMFFPSRLEAQHETTCLRETRGACGTGRVVADVQVFVKWHINAERQQQKYKASLAAFR